MHDLEEHPTRKEFLDLLWRETINSAMPEDWIDNSISASKKAPNAPFGDIGPALERLLSLGASKRDLSLIYRKASYEAVFETLYNINDPGINPDEAAMLFKDLLMSDPSDLVAGPGSAPEKKYSNLLKSLIEAD